MRLQHILHCDRPVQYIIRIANDTLRMVQENNLLLRRLPDNELFAMSSGPYGMLSMDGEVFKVNGLQGKLKQFFALMPAEDAEAGQQAAAGGYFLGS